jgi:predicted NodU family carbamoyl transferase
VVQVTASSDPWVYDLLAAVKRRTGWGVLINTSFNTKGKPILNTVAEALALLRDCEDLDYVLIEDFLFAKAAVGAF